MSSDFGWGGGGKVVIEKFPTAEDQFVVETHRAYGVFVLAALITQAAAWRWIQSYCQILWVPANLIIQGGPKIPDGFQIKTTM